MNQTTDQVARPRLTTVVGALVLGVAVLVLLFPASGVDSDPPVCRSMFFYVVPCEDWVAWVAGAATASLVGLAMWASDRRRRAVGR